MQIDKFSAEKRRKIWTSRFKEASFSVSEETIEDISLRELNRHEIDHLFENLQLYYPPGHDQAVSTAAIAELKALTCSLEEESFPQSGSPPCLPNRDQSSPSDLTISKD